MSILVVGSLHLDVLARAPRLPRLDETVTGTSIDYVFGGKGGNQAVAAARMGAKVHFAGRVGSDTFGEMIRAQLHAVDVECTQVQIDPGASGMSTAVVDDDGSYGAVIVSGANLEIAADQIKLPEGTRLVLLQNEIPEAVNLAVALLARAAGIPVWLNAAPARPVSDTLLAQIDMMIVNRIEADFYCDLPRDLAVLTTCGPEGVLHKGHHTPAYPVNVISTHGAGDMFAGALAAAVVSGTTLADALDTAQAAAALHVCSDIPTRATLTPDKVQAFIRSHSNR